MSILELLQHIVNEPAPKLVPPEQFPESARDFTDKCLLKNPDERPAPKTLMVCLFLHFFYAIMRFWCRCGSDDASVLFRNMSGLYGRERLHWI